MPKNRGKLARLICVNCGRQIPVMGWDYLLDKCSHCGQTDQEAIRLKRLQARMRAAGRRLRRLHDAEILAKLKGTM